MKDMFWYMDTGTHYHIHCQIRPKPGDLEMKVIQVDIIPKIEGHDIESVVSRVVDQLNDAARYWAENESNT